MDAICRDPLWDLNVTWNTDIPDFTDCFQNTILVWVPAAFLVLTTPYELWMQSISRVADIPWNQLNVMKLVLLLIQIILSLAVIIGNFSWKTGDGSNTIAAVLLLLSYIVITILVVRGRRKGIQSSGTLFYYWFVQSCCITARYRSVILKCLYSPELEETWRMGIEVAVFPIAWAQFLLSCRAERAPKINKDQHLIKPNFSPESGSSTLSQLIFWYINPLMMMGYRKPLTEADQWSLSPRYRCSVLFKRFNHCWEGEIAKSQRIGYFGCTPSKPSIVYAIAKTFWAPLVAGFWLKLASSLITYVSPQVLNLIISYTSSDEQVWKGIFYSIILFLAGELLSLVENQYFYLMFKIAAEIRSALIAAIYKKSLVLSNNERRDSTVGEIVNLMAVDTQRFLDLMPFLNIIWSAPLQIILAIYFLWETIGPSVLSGVVVMLIAVPVNGVVAKISHRLMVSNMSLKDDRTKMMNEILNGIRVLKLYAWEFPFIKQVLDVRSKELAELRNMAYLNATSMLMWAIAPFLVAITSFITFIFVDENNILTPNIAFVSLSLFSLMRVPLILLPHLISSLIQTNVSVNRINKFMRGEELDFSAVGHRKNQTEAVRITDGLFSWGDNGSANVLEDINLSIKPKSLVAIVGRVGAGKSSLISAILGELNKIRGYVNVDGSLAYVPQTAWIRNASIKDNIIMHRPKNNEKYQKIVNACGLDVDLDILAAGDKTEIGEKGINLSGGQKQRISLARAVYSRPDIILLDDPLSAVDAHVGKHIFDNVIGPDGILNDTTRIMVTHGVSYLPKCDNIIVMKDGKIGEVGSYNELVSSGGAFAEFLIQYMKETEENPDITAEHLDQTLLNENIATENRRSFSLHQEAGCDINASSPHLMTAERAVSIMSLDRKLPVDDKKSFSLHQEDDHDINASSSHSMATEMAASIMSLDRQLSVDDKMTGQLIDVEEVDTGGISWKVYYAYAKTIGIIIFTIFSLSWLLSEVSYAGSNLWLSEWSTDPLPANGTVDTKLRDFRLVIYGIFGLCEACFVFLGSMGFAYGTVKAANILHANMLHNIMRSPLSFFDTTPMGRIINRFSKDINVLDVNIIWNITDMLGNTCRVIMTVIVISTQTPVFLAAFLPMTVFYYFLQKIYLASSRQLKRLESKTRSPIYVHFSESLNGASSIRAYKMEKEFITENDEKVDLNLECYLPAVQGNRWLTIRIELLGNLIILCTALFAVLSKGSIDAGAVGLSVSYAMAGTLELNWMVRTSSQFETNMVCTERILEYSNVEGEAKWEIESMKPPPDWPSRGRIELKDYSTRYRAGLDLVLKNVSCEIEPLEKIGICGRTGAGKSSLTLALFRIIESTAGKIFIDGIDISTMGLHDLRSKLTIIPQDPVLFSGTLRRNLDPFESYSDSEIWTALEHSHLKSFVSTLQDGLLFNVAEGGENLSVGQRQLICLSRALLRKTKILFLDEATAAVDLETDDLIQETIRKEFKDCTIITIAHRLNTIMDSSRILVLNEGRIAEFDTPQNLLLDKDSIFHSMAKDARLV